MIVFYLFMINVLGLVFCFLKIPHDIQTYEVPEVEEREKQ